MFIVFTNFKVKTDFDSSINNPWKAYGTELCTQDWLEIYQLFQDGTEELVRTYNYCILSQLLFYCNFFMEILLQVGRYCSTSSPGPVVSLQKVALGLRVNFYTDNANVSSGFMGQYTFFEEKSAFGGKKKLKLFLRKERKSGYKYILKNRVKNNRKTFEIPTQSRNYKNLSVVFYSLNIY